METVRFVFSVKFYLEMQWKSMPAVVFREKVITPGKPDKSNLFKGLFCQ